MVKLEDDTEDAGVSSRGNLSVVPKTEPSDVSPSFAPIQLKEECGASSSSNNLRSQFVAMGFSLALVDKVLKQNGDNNADVILNDLLVHSDLENRGAESSISLEGLFDSDKEEEVETKPSAIYTEKRSYLISMNFSEQQIDSALWQLGEEAPLEQLVECIISSQDRDFSEENEIKPSINTYDSLDGESNNENLYGVAEKTLSLLRMGFTEQEVSAAIDNFGVKISVMALADSILSSRVGGGTHHLDDSKEHVFTDTSCFNPSTSNAGFYYDNDNIIQPNKRPKHIFIDDTRFNNPLSVKDETNQNTTPGTSRAKNVSGPPYFIYGNVVAVSRETWCRLSQFLYNIEPEFVNSQFFSALIRKEGFIHNLPTEERHYIVPKSPVTIEAALPFTRKFWPSWDPRRQLNNTVGTDTIGIDTRQLSDRLGKMVQDSRALLSSEKRANILEQCKNFNLIWVGESKLSPLEPHQLERVMGYPVNHTHLFGLDPVDQSKAMKDCFQTDTMGYVLSPLKGLYLDGVRVLSVYTGIGGAEVALHRLGVRIKCVVSVEASETNRKILKRWWNNSEQTGDLRQFGGINKLTTGKIEELVKEFGGFDLIVGSNPSMLTTGGSSSYSTLAGMDSNSFFEFVRIIQRVRSIMGSSN